MGGSWEDEGVVNNQNALCKPSTQTLCERGACRQLEFFYGPEFVSLNE